MINQLEWITTPWLEPSNARQTLGVCLAPNGNYLAKVQYLQEEAAAWARKMARVNLSQINAEFSLWQVLQTKLVYPLTATKFGSAMLWHTETSTNEHVTSDGH